MGIFSRTAMSSLVFATAAMFLQQTFVALGRSLPAVIAPAIIADLKLAPAWVGIYFGIYLGVYLGIYCRY